MLVDRHAGGFGGNAQRLRQFAVVDLMVFRRKQRAGDFPGKPRLACAGRGGRQPFERQIEPALKLQAMGDFCLIVGSQCEHQRTLARAIRRRCRSRAAVRRQRPASAPGSRGRARPTPLPGLGLAAGRQHPGRRMARAPPALPRSKIVTAARPASRQAIPSPITPAPIMTTCGRRAAGVMERCVALNAAPFAGMTQTEVLSASNYNSLGCQRSLTTRIGAKGFLARVSNLVPVILMSCPRLTCDDLALDFIENYHCRAGTNHVHGFAANGGTAKCGPSFLCRCGTGNNHNP